MSTRSELITIERETNVRRPGGGVDSGWSSVGQIWASAEYIGGSEGEARGAQRSTLRYRFVGLSAAIEAIGVTVKDRVLWNGERYNIREVPRRLARRVETQIIGETGVTQ